MRNKVLKMLLSFVIMLVVSNVIYADNEINIKLNNFKNGELLIDFDCTVNPPEKGILIIENIFNNKHKKLSTMAINTEGNVIVANNKYEKLIVEDNFIIGYYNNKYRDIFNLKGEKLNKDLLLEWKGEPFTLDNSSYISVKAEDKENMFYVLSNSGDIFKNVLVAYKQNKENSNKLVIVEKYEIPKYGLIKDNEVIFEPIYDNIKVLSNNYIFTKNNGKWTLYNDELKPLLYDIEEIDEYSDKFRYGLFGIVDNKVGYYINTQGEKVLNVGHFSTTEFDRGIAVLEENVKHNSNRNIKVVDLNNNILVNFGRRYEFVSKYYNGVAAARKYNHNFELVDISGKVVSKEYTDLFIDDQGVIKIYDNFKDVGFFSVQNKEIKGFSYLGNFNEYKQAEFSKVNSKYVGIIDNTGKVIVPDKYDYIEEHNLVYNCENKEGVFYYDTEGKMINKNNIFISSLFFQKRAITENKKGCNGIIDIDGNYILKPKLNNYSIQGHYSEGLVSIYKEVDDKIFYGFANLNGDIIIPLKYSNAQYTYFSSREGIILVKDRETGYNILLRNPLNSLEQTVFFENTTNKKMKEISTGFNSEILESTTKKLFILMQTIVGKDLK